MNDDELLHLADRFRVVRRRRQTDDGREFSRQVILHPGAVAIVAVVDAEHVCLIRNYRVAVERELIEVPAGTLEVGEPPAATARRELEEETGYIAGRLEPLTELLMSPGILNERIYVFVAGDLQPGPAQREANEEIQNYIVRLDDAMAMIERGEIEDAKTIAALLLYDRRRASIRRT
ncbi:MAG: NUDIX hydrolase [Pirellula sp.]|nr:NUDIX hydrolase [Pirellula sp.]